MRLWTIHPKYLDVKGLVALWREGLLAKAVLEGKTKGYRNHPQLIRFREQSHAKDVLCEYLRVVLAEAENRGYHFDKTKLPKEKVAVKQMEASTGQLSYEWRHFLKKLCVRQPDRFEELSGIEHVEPHPLFGIVSGDVETWERVTK